jgi:phosphoenolpyruvate phosphomutase-like protein
MENPNKKLRELVGRKKPILLPGAANALTARVIEELGFEAIYVTGAGVTNAFLGMPDIGLISVTELAEHVRAMRDAVGLPLIVDADTGFGNAINVARTLKLLERGGASAIQLEDQEFPKRCGHFSGKSVVPRAEMVQKIHAAADARVDGDMMIVARTDAIAVNGFDDAIERAQAYIEAGADMTFVEADRGDPEASRCAAAYQYRRRRADADAEPGRARADGLFAGALCQRRAAGLARRDAECARPFEGEWFAARRPEPARDLHRAAAAGAKTAFRCAGKEVLVEIRKCQKRHRLTTIRIPAPSRNSFPVCVTRISRTR